MLKHVRKELGFLTKLYFIPRKLSIIFVNRNKVVKKKQIFHQWPQSVHKIVAQYKLSLLTYTHTVQKSQ